MSYGIDFSSIWRTSGLYFLCFPAIEFWWNCRCCCFCLSMVDLKWVRVDNGRTSVCELCATLFQTFWFFLVCFMWGSFWHPLGSILVALFILGIILAQGWSLWASFRSRFDFVSSKCFFSAPESAKHLQTTARHPRPKNSLLQCH